MGDQGVCEPVSVIVLAAGCGASLDECLSALSEQVRAPEMVITVVDSVPSDGAAALALAHPAVHWVTLASADGLRALYQRGFECVRSPRAAFLSAAYRPDTQWLARGMKQLSGGAEVVIGGGSDGTGPGVGSLFLAGHVPTRFPFSYLTPVDEDLIDEFFHRCAAAGFDVLIDEQAPVKPIARAPAPKLATRTGSRDADRPSLGLAPRSLPRPKNRAAEAAELISVVLCTAGRRPEQLELCLKSLSGLDDCNFEIVVVENAPSTSLSKEQLEAVGARHVLETKRGLDHARNRGVKESRGEIIAFIDDDREADPGWVKGVRGAFADPMIAFVTGRVRPARLDQESHQWFEVRFPFDRGPYPLRFTRFDGGGISPLLMGVVGTGPNMAFRRDLLRRVREFDRALDMGTLVGGGGDLDMFARALAAGEVCQYAPDAVVFHHHRDDMTKLRWQTWGYGLSEGAMCAKYALTM